MSNDLTANDLAVPQMPGPYEPSDAWTFRDPDFGLVLSNCRMCLVWEPEGAASFAANWRPSEISARDLFLRWRNETLGASGTAIVSWTVRVERRSGKLRSLDHYVAPFQPGAVCLFDDPRTVPVNERTGERINWLRVPVADQTWGPDSTDPAGFIQAALGWKPGPLQRTLDCDRLWTAATGRPPEPVTETRPIITGPSI